MREIKFSCMWTDGESWMDLRYTLDQMENGMHWEEMSDNPMLRKFKLKHKRQFTGLKDRNGVEIYESDIVYAKANDSYYRVMHDLYDHAQIDDKDSPTCYGWFVTRQNEPVCGYLDGESLEGSDIYLEVCGNIFQNKELLE